MPSTGMYLTQNQVSTNEVSSLRSQVAKNVPPEPLGEILGAFLRPVIVKKAHPPENPADHHRPAE
jgi:hypothetical protein